MTWLLILACCVLRAAPYSAVQRVLQALLLGPSAVSAKAKRAAASQLSVRPKRRAFQSLNTAVRQRGRIRNGDCCDDKSAAREIRRGLSPHRTPPSPQTSLLIRLLVPLAVYGGASTHHADATIAPAPARWRTGRHVVAEALRSIRMLVAWGRASLTPETTPRRAYPRRAVGRG